MYPRAILSLALAIVCAFTLAGAQEAAKPAAPDTQVMDWVFAMPQGWRVANSRLPILANELVLEQPERAAEWLTQLTFGRPGDIDGDFRKWFDVHWENLKKDYKSPGLDAPTESDGGAGHKLVAGVGAIKMDGGKQRVVMLVGVNKGKRAGVMCFITEDLEQLEANAGRMDGLLASVRFASQRPRDEKAPALRTKADPMVTPSFLRDDWKGWPAGNFPLEGLWGRESVTTDLWTHHGGQYRSTYFYRMFFKDGTVLNRMPAEGLLSFDPAWLRSEFADYMGTYTVEDDVVTVTTGSPGKQQLIEKLTRKGDDLYLGEAGYKRIIADPPALDGTYIKIDYQRHAPESHKRIAFRPDGSFVDEGFNSILGVRWWCGDSYWLSGFPAQPGSGRWRVEKNTLELIYEDGRKHRFAFHVHHDIANKDLKYVVLNGRFMMRLGEPDKAAPEPKPEPPAAVQAPPAADGPDTQIMDWVFAMPEGWRVANSRLTLLMTKDLALEHTARASEVLTQVTFGRPVDFEGGFRKWYDGHFENLKKDYPNGQFEAPTESDGPGGHKHIAGVGAVKMDNGNQRVVMLIGVNKGKRAGAMCFITEDLEHLQANAARLDAMLPTVSFASQRGAGDKAPAMRRKVDPDVTPSYLWDNWKGWPKGNAPLEGLWGRQSIQVQFIGTAMTTTYRSSYVYLLFFKDGTVLTRMPPEGLLSFDVDFLKNEFKDYFGTYTVEGDTVTVTTGGGGMAVEIQQFTRKGDELHKGEAVYKPIVDEKPALDGGYIKVDYQSHAERFHKGIRFAADGRFADEGFNAMLFTKWWQADNYWLLDQFAEPGTGRWRIEKNTLELTYDDGRRRRFAFHLHRYEGPEAAATYLVLNTVFIKQHPINATLPPKRGAAPEPATESAPALTADTRLGDWEFKLPAAWSIKAGTKGQPTLRPGHTPVDLDSWAECGTTESIKDELAAWFDKHWQAAKKRYGVEQADPAQGAQTEHKFDMMAAGALGSHGGKPCLVMLAALHKGGRAAVCSFVTTDLQRAEADIAALNTLLADARLASCRAPGEAAPNLKTHIDPLCTPSFLWDPAPEPIRGDQPLSGIYGTPSMRATGVVGLAANEQVFKYYTFFADGRVLRQMPPEGLLSFRYEHWQQHFKFDCGSYKVEGDNIVVTLSRPEGAPEVVTLKREGEMLARGDVKFRPIAQDQPKPEGRWLRMNHERREERFRLGITFNKDGTFKDEGFNSTTRIGWWCGSDFMLRDVEAGPVAGAGKWRVEKNTLELIYDDGRKRRFGYHQLENDGTKYLVLNGDYFTQ